MKDTAIPSHPGCCRDKLPAHSRDTALLSSSMGMCLMLPHNPTTTSSTTSCLPKEPFPQTFYIPPDRHDKQLAMLTSWKPKEENSHHCFSPLLSPASRSPSGIWTLGIDVKNLMWLQEGRIWNCFPVHAMAPWSVVFEATAQAQLVKSTSL